MSKKKKESFFWTSYSDLMTNLFFVMLMLFILAIALLHREVVKIGEERDATKEQLKKIQELEKSIEHIDAQYFLGVMYTKGDGVRQEEYEVGEVGKAQIKIDIYMYSKRRPERVAFYYCQRY